MKLSLAAFSPDLIEYDETTQTMTLGWRVPAIKIELTLEYLVSVLSYLPVTVRESLSERIVNKGLTVGAVVTASEPEAPGDIPENAVKQWQPVAVDDSASQSLYDRVWTDMAAFTESMPLGELVEPVLLAAATAYVVAGYNDSDEILDAMTDRLADLEESVKTAIKALQGPSSSAQN